MKPKYIILHHSASPQNTTFESINAYHKRKWNFRSALGFYAGYQYIITSDGKIHQARKDTEAGAHCKDDGMNYKSIGICLTGWYDDGHDDLPTKKQQKNLRKLLREKMKEWDIKKINFHRDFAKKTCPGLHITKKWITNLLKKPMEYEENFRKIFKYVKSLIEKDFGKNPSDKETKEIKKDLKDIKQTFKLMSAQNTQLRNVATTFDVKINELETARDIQAATIDEIEEKMKNQTAQIGVLEGRNRDLKKELKSKEALISKDAESAGIIKALEFVFRAMMAKIK